MGIIQNEQEEVKSFFDMIDKIDRIGVKGILCGRPVGGASGSGGPFSMRASTRGLLAVAVVLAYHTERADLGRFGRAICDLGGD